MNRAILLLTPILMVSLAQADTLTLKDGRAIKGHLTGYAGRKFEFVANDGAIYSEYALDVKSIIPDTPVKVSMKFSAKQYDSVDFVQFDSFTIRVKKNGQQLNEPVISLTTMELVVPADRIRDEHPGEPGKVDFAGGGGRAPGAPLGDDMTRPREWRRVGKWREMDEDQTSVISHGEEVDINTVLKKGYVNIVQFHYRKSLASVREGNYVDAIAAKKTNRIVVLKVVVADFNAPICKALNVQGFPQFWFYNAQGKQVKKLTDRFTEGDIDAAIKEARRGGPF